MHDSLFAVGCSFFTLVAAVMAEEGVEGWKEQHQQRCQQGTLITRHYADVVQKRIQRHNCMVRTKRKNTLVAEVMGAAAVAGDWEGEEGEAKEEAGLAASAGAGGFDTVGTT